MCFILLDHTGDNRIPLLVMADVFLRLPMALSSTNVPASFGRRQMEGPYATLLADTDSECFELKQTFGNCISVL